MRWVATWSAALVLAACSASGKPAGTVTADCRAAMTAVVGVPDGPDIFDATLDACGDALEWMNALREYPSAMGLRGAEFVSNLEIQIVCDSKRETAVCADAEDRGLLPTTPATSTTTS